MVTLSLVFSITAFVLVAQNNEFLMPNYQQKPTAQPPTNSPTYPPIVTTPTPTALQADIIVDVVDRKTESITNDQIRVTYTVSATYNSGLATTIHYSDFGLDLRVMRMTWVQSAGNADLKNSGAVTISSTHTTETFQLVFEHPRLVSNGMDDTSVVGYILYYKGVIVQ
jgi:hypothetical protein